MYPSPLKGINSTVLSKSQTWMTAATHSEFSIKSNFCLKDIPTSPGLCFDEEKVHNKTLPALITSEWFLSSMNSRVKLKMMFVCEALSTLRAGERFLGSSLFGLRATQMLFFSFDMIILTNFTQFFFHFDFFNRL